MVWRRQWRSLIAAEPVAATRCWSASRRCPARQHDDHPAGRAGGALAGLRRDGWPPAQAALKATVGLDLGGRPPGRAGAERRPHPGPGDRPAARPGAGRRAADRRSRVLEPGGAGGDRRRTGLLPQPLHRPARVVLPPAASGSTCPPGWRARAATNSTCRCRSGRRAGSGPAAGGPGAAPRWPTRAADGRGRTRGGRARRRRRLALADWTLLVTNAPPDLLGVAEALVLGCAPAGRSSCSSSSGSRTGGSTSGAAPTRAHPVRALRQADGDALPALAAPRRRLDARRPLPGACGQTVPGARARHRHARSPAPAACATSSRRSPGAGRRPRHPRRRHPSPSQLLPIHARGLSLMRMGHTAMRPCPEYERVEMDSRVHPGQGVSPYAPTTFPRPVDATALMSISTDNRTAARRRFR